MRREYTKDENGMQTLKIKTKEKTKILTTKHWDKFKRYKTANSAKVIPALKSIGENGQAHYISHCGDYINVAECSSSRTKHYKGHLRCNCRWCINCMYFKTLCWMARLIPVFEEWLDDGNYITMLNFTVRDGKLLDERLKFLEESYRKLYNGNKKRRTLWDERFPGGVKSLEVKTGKNSGEWHPHFHCLVMQPKGSYVKDYDWVSETWHGIVGHNGRDVVRKDGTPDKDWNGNVFIKKIRHRRTKNGYQGLVKTMCEVLKYILKCDESIFGEPGEPMGSYERFKEAHGVLKGKRQISTWGLLHGIRNAVEKDMENEDWDEKKLVDFICQKCGCTEATLKLMSYGALINSGAVLYDTSAKIVKCKSENKAETAEITEKGTTDENRVPDSEGIGREAANGLPQNRFRQYTGHRQPPRYRANRTRDGCRIRDG